MKNMVGSVMKKITIGLFIIFGLILLLISTKPKPVIQDKDIAKVETVKEVKTWQPKDIAEYNQAYTSKSYTNVDGSNAVINVASVKVRENDIVIEVPAPSYNDIKYAIDNYLAIQVMDENGKDLSGTLDKILVSQVSSEMNEIIITGIDTKAVKWLEIMPYKTKDNNTITFKI